MKDYYPEYNKCKDSRKEIYHGVCKHNVKNKVMLCNLHNNHICCAWEGYIHSGDYEKEIECKNP
jgi:hypothetical protein